MHKVDPKKRLGQHFLKDKSICERIANLYGSQAIAPRVMEIGPGMGALTEFLLKRPELDTWCMEVDDESVLYLDRHFPSLKGKVIFGDFLREDLTPIMAGEKMGVIGNFPYNISSQILFKCLEYRNQIPEIVGMFQKEVALRLAEKPGSKTYGILSVLLQAFYDIEYCFTVDEHVFSPPPKVKSAVIRCVRNERETLGCDEKLFIQVVKTSFNQRRKTMRNALKPIIQQADLPFLDLRAERLSVDDFIELTKQIAAAKKATN
jgi:16S rRNA (adenine1518-N6/adenine1519-N6)-dimethyltransferase